VSGSPAIRTVPASRRKTPATIEIVVVLPAPFGPSRPYVSPGAMAKPTPSTAVRSPNRRTRPLHASTGSRGGASGSVCTPLTMARGADGRAGPLQPSSPET
jgi:hypothetical protein